jgi:predicted DNA-binding protein
MKQKQRTQSTFERSTVTESKQIAVRLNDQMHIDLDKACKKIGCTKSAFIVEAIAWALENEAKAVHVPLAVQQAAIKTDKSGRVRMPTRQQMPSMVSLARRG